MIITILNAGVLGNLSKASLTLYIAIKSVCDLTIFLHLAVEMRESYIMTSVANFSVLKQSARVGHTSVMMDSDIKIRLKNIIKSGSGVVRIIGTIRGCNRLVNTHDSIIAIGLFTITLEPGKAKIFSSQRIAERSATRTDLSKASVTSISSEADFMSMMGRSQRNAKRLMRFQGPRAVL